MSELNKFMNVRMTLTLKQELERRAESVGLSCG